MVSAVALATPPAYDRARAVAHFSGSMRTLVHQFKYADRHDARALFGRWLAEAGPRAAGRGRRDRAGAADPLAAAVAPVQPGRHPGPGALAADRPGRRPACSCSARASPRPRSASPTTSGAATWRVPSACPAAERRRLQGRNVLLDRRRHHHRRHRRGLRPGPQAGRCGPRRRAGPGAGHQRGPGGGLSWKRVSAATPSRLTGSVDVSCRCALRVIGRLCAARGEALHCAVRAVLRGACRSMAQDKTGRIPRRASCRCARAAAWRRTWRDAGELIREAARQGAQYVQTPEITTLMETERERLFATVRPEEGNPAIAHFRGLARELGIWLHVGSMAHPARQRQDRQPLAADLARAARSRRASTRSTCSTCDLPGGESYREVQELPGRRHGRAGRAALGHAGR